MLTHTRAFNCLLLCATLLASSHLSAQPTLQSGVKVYLAGDSTMSNKEVRAYPETGWGMPFAYFFDSSVTIENRAKNGRSTKTFLSEGLWQSLVKDVQPGDYVLIQFGHNDESKEKVGVTLRRRNTRPTSFASSAKRVAKKQLRSS